jgi:hypothetical protein
LRVPVGRGAQISGQSAHKGGNVYSPTHLLSFPLPLENIPINHLYYRLSRTQVHSEARRRMSINNSNDTIGNRTRGLPACSAVSEPTAQTRVKACKIADILYEHSCTPVQYILNLIILKEHIYSKIYGFKYV